MNFKTVQFIVSFIGKIPENSNLRDVFIDLELDNVRVARFSESGKPVYTSGSLSDYETLDVEELTS